MTDQTLVLLKPDAVARGLIGTILSRYEAKSLEVRALQMRTADAAMSDQHYAEHREKPFYLELKEYITSGPLVAVVLEGERVIEAVRSLNGATDGIKAAPGTIRGDYAPAGTQNLVHASDSPESAAREIALWFPELDA